ncbi:MAG: dihydroneopterin aldolase [Campylobacteraceae bacterium]|nr:dihydroneopterin aldolase [Campylobacteraceae bacterium]MBT3882909.1 dihydroneopterin aldolase [Campylobacteraceae bacterium]MBT4031074.1 dihydroneopterin aldolase [Campylobacteraceae bacterium]MBT4179724.1 dihydroneopterin aldolase [Campylobacteraceae bacterium]MBT4572853.1 dihydroneopterin aldolase [Campylobacteraceae bacterium]
MKVKINNLEFKTIIGILKDERKNKQKVIVDLSFKYDYKNSDFIDYSEVALLVKQNIKQQRFGLIEDAILDTKDLLEYKFNIKKLKMKITKPDILKDCLVSVEG